MNIPEYAKMVRVSKKTTSTILGNHFNTNIILHSILNLYDISMEDYDVSIDTSRASYGMIKYRIKPLLNQDLSDIQYKYDNQTISLFGKTYISTTKILNDTLVITMYEK